MMSPDGSPQPQASSPPPRLARRGLLLGTMGVLGLAAIAGGRWFNVTAGVSGGDLTAPEAHAAALSGAVLLVDIRRPDEWALTGVGEGAVPLDMRRADFIEALAARAGGRREAPLALICARGVRSARMAARLAEARFASVLNVPEGMLGSGAGPGWVKRGLPVLQVSG